MEDNRQQRPEPNNKNRKFSWTWIYLIIAALLLGYYFFGGRNNARMESISDTELKEYVLNKDVDKAVFVQKDEKVHIYLKKDSIDANKKFEQFRGKNIDGPHFSLEQSDYKAFKDDLDGWISAESRRRAADSIAALQKLAVENAEKMSVDIPDRDVLADNLRDDYVFPVEQDNSRSWGGEINQEKPITDLELRRLVVNKDIGKVVFVQKDEKVKVYLKKESIVAKSEFKDFRKKNLDGPHYSLEQFDYKAFKDDLNGWISAESRRRAADSIAVLQKLAVENAEKMSVDIPDRDVLADNLRDDYVFPVEQDNSKSWGGEIIVWMLPMLFIILMFFLVSRSMRGGAGGGVFSIGKSKAQVYDSKNAQGISFKDVAGLEGAKEEVEEIVDFLKNPKKYTVLGGKIPKGALLVGPPGTGKTLLAKAVAGEAKVPFFSLSGSDFVEMFVGVGASRVRDLFKTAKEKAPCIIFIDEIDAIGRARGRNAISGANDERENTLNQLLTEMDGFSTNAGVIILAATNRADILDRALLRAGRFDRQIHVELPNLNERKGIFQVHVRNLKLDSNVDLEFFAKQTPGFSGADIANVCNEAALVAARNSKDSIGKEDFLSAIDRIIGGLEKRSSIISPEEKRVIAFHEAGHATVSWFLKYAAPLTKVTIVPRGKSLGAAWYIPEERHITNFEQMFDEMCALLGGRAAESTVFGKLYTGAQNDLERATKMAFAMITYYGLDPVIGNLSYYDSTGQNDYAFQRPYSEKTAEEIDNQVHQLVESAYTKAKEILETHKEQLNVLAQILIDREVIFAEDLEKIYGKRPSDATEKPGEQATNSDESVAMEEHSVADEQDNTQQDGKE